MGLTGSNGNTGSNGITGVSGITGSSGITGTVGSNGNNGPTLLSGFPFNYPVPTDGTRRKLFVMYITGF